MPLTKNAMIRYQTLDRCFRNSGRQYTLDDLLEECNKALYEHGGIEEGIHRRQLQKDIAYMESEHGWAIPLERIRFGEKNQKMYFRYSDLKFSINNQPLNETEARQLRAAIQILGRFTGSPQFDWVNEMIPVIENKLGLVGKEKTVIEFDTNEDAQGREHLTPLFNAIVNKSVLEVTYKPFKSVDPFSFIFHPYYIKQYNNRWFVFGLNEGLMKSDWNIALDRIQAMKVTDKTYQEDETDWESYFYDMIGVTKPEGAEVEEVKLRFMNEQAPYIITKPLHPSQKKAIELEDGSIEVRISVVINFELKRLLLGFGDRVEVIYPKTLREQIATGHAMAADQYRE